MKDIPEAYWPIAKVIADTLCMPVPEAMKFMRGALGEEQFWKLLTETRLVTINGPDGRSITMMTGITAPATPKNGDDIWV